MAHELVLKNGRIVSPGLDFVGDLAISGERIAAIGHGLAGRQELDVSGKLVIPGGIDGHVHMRTERPAFRYDELFSTGSVAAAFGGTTTMVDQVQAQYGLTLNQELDTRMALADGQTAIDFTFHMNIREPIEERLREIPSIFARGISSFKWFMSPDGWRVPDDYLLRGMHEVAGRGGLSIVHAENDATIKESIRRAKAEGRTGLRDFASRYSSGIEGATAALVAAMAESAGGRVLIFHVTSREAVEALKAAKARGVKAHGELALVWATHTDEVMHGDPVEAMSFLLAPPLRDLGHQNALWAGLADGGLDVVGTDHALIRPVPEARALEVASYFGLDLTFPPPDENSLYDDEGRRLIPMLAPGGVEVRLPLMYTIGVLEGRISLERWIEVCCSEPADLFDLHTKGRLEPGRDADVVVFDPERLHTYSAANLHSNSNYSVWEGWTTKGVVEKTISRGRLIVDGDAFLGSPDHGRFIKRTVARP
jgi:dihydropyrimidinase